MSVDCSISRVPAVARGVSFMIEYISYEKQWNFSSHGTREL